MVLGMLFKLDEASYHAKGGISDLVSQVDPGYRLNLSKKTAHRSGHWMLGQSHALSRRTSLVIKLSTEPQALRGFRSSNTFRALQ